MMREGPAPPSQKRRENNRPRGHHRCARPRGSLPLPLALALTLALALPLALTLALALSLSLSGRLQLEVAVLEDLGNAV